MDPPRGILVFLLYLLIAKSGCVKAAERRWWETALIYQIWPRGFLDSDGNGEGDLKGIIQGLDYLQNLGIDAIWLNPIYSSPLIDSGYDISNYTSINPLFGNLQHFDELVYEAHKRKLKIILDIVPNHSSDEHKWFQLSIKNVEPYKNYYVWANGSTDAKGNKLPPNNWVSTYSNQEGSGWTWHDARQQWYYHKFHKSEPDLNLRNKNVVQELLNVFEFWLRRNVDGFRISAESYLYEDESLRNEPVVGNGIYTSGLTENIHLMYMFHSHINNWVKMHNSTPKFLIAESYDSDDALISLYGNSTHVGIPPFNFHFITSIQNTSTADHIKNVLEDWLKKLPDNTNTNWILSSHDFPRAASRIGLNRVDGLHMLSLLLPGQAYTYYGEEIAMLDRAMSWEETIDPMGCARTEAIYGNYSRDPARAPMQWNSTVSAGFSKNETTYLPIHPNYKERNVAVQQNLTRSNLNIYKSLAALRKNIVFMDGDYEFATLNNNHVLVLRRFLENYPSYVIVINLSLRQEKVNLTLLYPSINDPVEIAVASSNAVHITTHISPSNIVLTANAAITLKIHENACTCETSTTSNGTNPTTPKAGTNSASLRTTKLSIATVACINILLLKFSMVL